MEWIGYILLVVAIFEFCFGLFESFTSEAGAIGQVPALMHAVASSFPFDLGSLFAAEPIHDSSSIVDMVSLHPPHLAVLKSVLSFSRMFPLRPT